MFVCLELFLHFAQEPAAIKEGNKGGGNIAAASAWENVQQTSGYLHSRSIRLKVSEARAV